MSIASAKIIIILFGLPWKTISTSWGFLFKDNLQNIKGYITIRINPSEFEKFYCDTDICFDVQEAEKERPFLCVLTYIFFFNLLMWAVILLAEFYCTLIH